MVKDIYEFSSSSYPDQFIVYKDKLYFRADGNDGFWTEMYVYDGVNPPNRISDIYPGSSSSGISDLAVFNNKLYFNANDGTHGYELWVYDGSSFSLVKDIESGSGSSAPTGMTVFNGVLYFSADDGGGYGIELWKYTGSGDPTRITDLEPGTAHSWPSGMVVFDNKLYFSATTSTYGTELYSYNGYTVSLVKDIWSGTNSSLPQYKTVYKGALYFNADGGGPAGSELWKYTGTGEPWRVKDIYKGSGDGSPARLFVFNEMLYFAAFDGSHGSELWSFDGNDENLVMDINPGAGGSYPQDFVEFMGKLYFIADDGNYGYELWVYDGADPPSMVIDLAPPSGNSPYGLTVLNQGLFFSADDGTHGSELWIYEYVIQQDMFYSQATYDGWVRETGETTNKGGLINTTNYTCYIGDDSGNRQYRTILHFNTSRLPDSAVITKASLQYKQMEYIGNDPNNTHGVLWADIKTGFFSNNPGLVKSDFGAASSMNNAGYFKFASSVTAYPIYRAPLKDNAFPYVNLSGNTQFRLRFGIDDDNDYTADYIKIFCGDMGVAYNRPNLRVWYYVP